MDPGIRSIRQEGESQSKHLQVSEGEQTVGVVVGQRCSGCKVECSLMVL